MTVQSKRKQTTRNVIGWLIAEQFKKKHKKDDTQQGHVKHESLRVGLNENLFKWMTPTV